MSEQSTPQMSTRERPKVIEIQTLPTRLLYCPYLNCWHHEDGHGFSKRSSLDDHIQHAHRGLWYQSTDDTSVIEVGDVAAYNSSSDDDSDHAFRRPSNRANSGGTWPLPDADHQSLPNSKDKQAVKSGQQDGNVVVNKDHLKQMENTIRQLQRRVDRCERVQDSSSDSDQSSLKSSTVSLFNKRKDKNRKLPRLCRRSSDDIITIDDGPHGKSRFHSPPPPPPGYSPAAAHHGPNPPDILPDEPFIDGPQFGPRLQIVRWKQCSTNFGDPEWHRDDASAVGLTSQDFSKKCLLTVIREFDRHQQFWRRRIQIASPTVISCLKDLALYDVDLESQDELRLAEPLMVLFHSRKQLHDLSQTAPTDARDQLHLILNFMLHEFVDVTQKLNDLESSYPSGLINYPDLWLLYAPGTVVYSRETGEHEAFVVHSIRGMQKRQKSTNGRHSHSRLDLTCWSINYDGEVFGRVWSAHTIAPFHGARAISSLNLIPEKFLPNGSTVKSELVARGKKFWSLPGQQFQEYTGEMYSQHNSDESVRVMVDHLTYQRRSNWPISIDNKRGPVNAQSNNWQDDRFSRRDRWGSGRSRRRVRNISPPYMEEQYVREFSPERDNGDDETRYQDPYKRYKVDRPACQMDEFVKYDVLKPDTTPDDFASLLTPQHVHGYCLRDKVWKDLNVTQLQPVAFRKNAWDRLVLDGEYKDIVQAMVSSYVDKTALLDDLVAGKGAGLVALLHGPPGSGKTLTAECVAENFGKPLYHISAGDIGTDAERLEERLEEVFDYACTWNCVLLLDEADIFLQDRDYVNLERNALVSIFLRTLEYFNGVLFLTTNRVGIFDQAFQSRVHISLGLPSLDEQRRASVWAIFLQDLAAKGAISDARFKTLSRVVDEKWRKEKLNGRQIRNAVRTALVVADKKGEMLGERDFETVLKIGREFEGYMGMLGKGEQNAGLEGFQEV